ncbi:substrate-binding periplasmic protein [Niveibacterium microcysteis]|uniref:Transporter substrate-binding domain-containing protein n=1 Tax=Niveibacterium microcysteis TaxID=2811415 RepID=A0ABX7MA48_9RHOO|nr:transporter substrate-binding domain-containing protein [Niveibacterium microcysteis]QSI78624.1 transporter substrate-binding domain-containing protein [Niveibacterium microcysteis]
MAQINQTIRLRVCLVLGTLTLAATVTHAEEPISLLYNPRVPYSYIDHGVVTGTIVTPVSHALTRAGIPFVWVETPFRRQLAIVRANTGRDCMAAAFRDPERETYGRFSQPILQNEQMALVVPKTAEAKFRRYGSLSSALADRTMRLLIKEGYSYGAAINASLATRAEANVAAYDEAQSIVRMLHEGMADALLMTTQEAKQTFMQKGLSPEDFAYVIYPDTPPGEWRHLFCSFKVPAHAIDAINEQIRARADTSGHSTRGGTVDDLSEAAHSP